MNKSTTSETRQTRQLTLAAAAALAVALAVFGGVFYLQKRAASGQQLTGPQLTEEERRLVQQQIDDHYKPSEKQLNERLAKAEWLREKLRPWALQNKELLKAMLKAKADDKEIVEKVWKAAPSIATINALGIKAEDLGSLKASAAGAAWFGWGPMNPYDPTKTPEQRKQQENRRVQRRHEQFAEVRDVELSNAPLYGSTVHLWASGRITQTAVVHKPVVVEHEGRMVNGVTAGDGPHEELVPPYEFLK